MRERFPVKKTTYLQSVGRLLPHRVGQILKELGYETWINSGQGNDLDLKVWYRGTLVLVAEVINWSIGSNLSEDRFRSMIKNLSNYSCDKVLIYTVLEKNKVHEFRRNGIKTLEIGYQLLPRCFYNFFKQKGQIKKRRMDSHITRRDIKNKLECFISSLNLKLLDKETSIQLSDALSRYHIYQFDKHEIPKPDVKFIRKAIIKAVHWFTGTISREVRKFHYEGKRFTLKYLIKDIPTILFHGTSTRFLEDIKSNGLLPKGESKVFLTDNILIAEIYAYRAAKRFEGYPVVLLVNVGHIKHKLTIEFDFYTKRSGGLVVLPYMQYTCSYIPPKRVVDAYIPPSFTAVLFELISILECIPNKTPEEKRELQYLRKVYYDKMK